MSTSNGHLPASSGDEPGTRNLSGNVSEPEISLGEWHQVEIYFRQSTTETSMDGTLRWWLDGELVGDHDNVNFVADDFQHFELAPTWGGIGEVKTQDDFYWFDHVRISAP
jgi:hypothetical protein